MRPKTEHGAESVFERMWKAGSRGSATAEMAKKGKGVAEESHMDGEKAQKQTSILFA